jgi:hypothetical protein
MREANYKAAKHRALARKPFLKTDGRYLSREQAHDRDGLYESQTGTASMENRGKRSGGD